MTLDHLHKHIESVFGVLPSRLVFVDADGDLVTVSSLEDLHFAHANKAGHELLLHATFAEAVPSAPAHQKPAPTGCVAQARARVPPHPPFFLTPPPARSHPPHHHDHAHGGHPERSHSPENHHRHEDHGHAAEGGAPPHPCRDESPPCHPHWAAGKGGRCPVPLWARTLMVKAAGHAARHHWGAHAEAWRNHCGVWRQQGQWGRGCKREW